jgi:uncharacterized membrane protein YidH (DUF202 family)
MPDEENMEYVQLVRNINLAIRKTRAAYEQTLLDCLRAAIWIIGLGFTVYKYLHETSRTIEGQKHFFTPQSMILIVFGLFILCLAPIEHHSNAKKIRRIYLLVQKSVLSVVNFLVQISV